MKNLGCCNGVVLACLAVSAALPTRPLLSRGRIAASASRALPMTGTMGGARWRESMKPEHRWSSFLQVHGDAGNVSSSREAIPLALQQHLLICDVGLGDGRTFKALVDTG